jgi:hypothetical protein
MQPCGARGIRRGKVRTSAGHIYGRNGSGSGYYQSAPDTPKVVPLFIPELLAETVGNLKVDENFFYARSTKTPWNRAPAGFLHVLFREGEHVWVTHNAKSPDGVLWQHRGLEGSSAKWVKIDPAEPTDVLPGPEDLTGNFNCLSWFTSGRQGVWYLTNPVDGRPHQDGRFRCGKSYRCLEAVTAWRHFILETDQAPEDQWLALLALVPLPIVAIYHSGGRGVHGLVRITASTKALADEIAHSLEDEYVPLGACDGSLTAFRLSRLPNCQREQTGRRQKLLYLNPGADGTPISELPVLRHF